MAAEDDGHEDRPRARRPAKKAAQQSSSKRTASKRSPSKRTASKRTASKRTTKRSPSKRAASEPASSEQSGSKGSDATETTSNGQGAGAVAERALRHLVDVAGRETEGVTGLQRSDDGWTVQVEVVEVRRVPNTTDVLALYEVEVDRQGELLGYRRVRRYVRGTPSEE